MPRRPARVTFVILFALLLCGAASAARAGAAPDSRAARAAAAPDSPAAPAADSSARRPPRWALVLSGGMARGLAQIGVLQALDEQGIRPDLIVGCSMGGLVGALYASGLSGVEIERVATHLDWSAALDARDELCGWRGMAMPRPWLRLVFRGGRLTFPPSIKDDSYLNFVLVEELLEGTVRCGGNFDRLPIPLRIVATDPQKLYPVVLSGGDLARAARATLSVPLVFPPVPMNGRLLVDGGTASNLPVGTARAAGAERVLAVDVAIPSPLLTEDTNALILAAHFLDMLNKRGQLADTLGAQDRLVWLKLPGVSAWDFAGARRMIQMGLRASRDSVRVFAAQMGIPTGCARPARPAGVVVPPVAGPVEWTDRNGRPLTRIATARAVLGAVPSGPVKLWTMREAYAKLYRSDLFESAWPQVEVRGDSTYARFEVRERPSEQVQVAAAYDNDVDLRTHAALILRRRSGPLPAYMSAQGALDRLGWRTQASLEGTSLQRGSTGWFLRGGVRELHTRIYDAHGLVATPLTSRREVMLGGQLRLPWGATVQAGAGYGHARHRSELREGFLVALRTEGNGLSRRRLDVVALRGATPYTAASGSADLRMGVGPWQIVPAIRGGAASDDAPLDELPALGGPRSFAGLHRDEWRGRRVLGFELCIQRPMRGDLRFHVAGQAARVEQGVSRADYGERLRVAGETGLEIATPLGPLHADFGFPQGGRPRFDFSIGQEF